MKPALHMLIGLPGSGKSTFVENTLIQPNQVLLSTDAYIENYAKSRNSTYDDCFEQAMKLAEKNLETNLTYALKNNSSIIWDQTNLTKKSRAKKLAKIPENYKKIAIVFSTIDFKTLTTRLKSRPGKTIPNHIIWNMMETFQFPTFDEGFELIYQVKC